MIDGKATDGVKAPWRERVVPIWYKLGQKTKKWTKQGEETSDQNDKIREGISVVVFQMDRRKLKMYVPKNWYHKSRDANERARYAGGK